MRISTSRGIPLSFHGNTLCAIAKSSRVKIESFLFIRIREETNIMIITGNDLVQTYPVETDSSVNIS